MNGDVVVLSTATPKMVDAGESVIDTESMFFSYLPKSEQRSISIPYLVGPEPGSYFDKREVRRFEISFEDSFGEPHVVRYPDVLNKPDDYERELPATVR